MKKLIGVVIVLILFLVLGCENPAEVKNYDDDKELDQQFLESLTGAQNRGGIGNPDHALEGTLWQVTPQGTVTGLSFDEAVALARQYRWIDTNGSGNSLEDAQNNAKAKAAAAGEPLVLAYVAQGFDYWAAEDSAWKQVYTSLIAEVVPGLSSLRVTSHSWSGHLVERIVRDYPQITHITYNPAHGNLKSGEMVDDYISDVRQSAARMVILAGWDDNVTTQGGGSAYRVWWGIAGYNSLYYAIQDNPQVSLFTIDDAGHGVTDMLDHGASFQY